MHAYFRIVFIRIYYNIGHILACQSFSISPDDSTNSIRLIHNRPTAMASFMRPMLRLPGQSLLRPCSLCRAGLSLPVPRRSFGAARLLRQQQQQQQKQQKQQQQEQESASAPDMDRMRAMYKTRNRTTMFYTLSVILGTVALSYGSVPLYKMVRSVQEFKNSRIQFKNSC